MRTQATSIDPRSGWRDGAMIDHSAADTLARLDGLASILDSAVRVPGTDIRIGVDALIGLVPIVGDLASKLISTYLIMEARRLGASRWLIARMAANTTLDAIVGVVPVVGDAFDIMYRANERNIRLLKGHIERNGLAGAHRREAPVIDLAASGKR